MKNQFSAIVLVAVVSTAAAFGFSISSPTIQIQSQSSTTALQAHKYEDAIDRRQMLSTLLSIPITTTLGITGLLLSPTPAMARAPGSKDLCASLVQITDASRSLQTNLLDMKLWNQYTLIDSEGRAGSTDGARRVLGGIAPQSGTAAIDAAKKTPLYRIDVAFVTVRKSVLLEGSDSDDDGSWTEELDLERFEELADRIVYNVSKADGNFYSVLFAMKGARMIEDIFVETRKLLEQSVRDLDEMIGLLKSAGAPCMG